MEKINSSKIRNIHHLPFQETPITRLPYYSTKYGVNLAAKRDDLGFQNLYGGNKARMLMYLIGNVPISSYDVLVTAGGPCSNFNRACALACAIYGIKMHLIAYTDEIEEYDTSLNYKLSLLTGIGVTRCDRNHVPEMIDKVIADYRNRGLRTRFIYAGGKSLEGFYSYYEAVHELKKQVEHIDHLFITCGTGTTLTGICAGIQKLYPGTTVHAISTARKWEVERAVLEEDMSQLNNYLESDYGFDNLRFYDNYIFGGYAKYNDVLLSTIYECISKEGMIIDPTYTGKAFHGMLDIISKDPSFKGKSILFWNTGGLFNILSAVATDNITIENSRVN